MEILYLAYGRATVYIGNDSREVSTGDLIIIHPCEVHSVYIEPELATMHYIIGLDPELLAPMPNLVFELKYLLPFEASLHPRQKVIPTSLEDTQFIQTLIRQLLIEYNGKQIGFELAVTAGIYQLVLWIVRNHSRQGLSLSPNPYEDISDMKAFQQMLAYIDAHFHEDITATDIAKISMMSYSHFAKRFKAFMNTPFIKYLNFMRIRKAEQLLLDPDKSITQIALDTGFHHTSFY